MLCSDTQTGLPTKLSARYFQTFFPVPFPHNRFPITFSGGSRRIVGYLTLFVPTSFFFFLYVHGNSRFLLWKSQILKENIRNVDTDNKLKAEVRIGQQILEQKFINQWPAARFTYNQYYTNVYIIAALQLWTHIKVTRLDGLW